MCTWGLHGGTIKRVRDIHTQVQTPDSTTVTLSLAPWCLQNLGTRLLLGQELQYSELKDVSTHVEAHSEVLAFTVSWVGVQYTLMPRQ